MPQLVNGSGEVLMTARVPALAAWVPAAIMPPPRSAATVCNSSFMKSSPPTAPAAMRAPAGMRMKVWIRSQMESRPGILSAKNSMKYSSAAAASTQVEDKTAMLSGREITPKASSPVA